MHPASVPASAVPNTHTNPIFEPIVLFIEFSLFAWSLFANLFFIIFPAVLLVTGPNSLADVVPLTLRQARAGQVCPRWSPSKALQLPCQQQPTQQFQSSEGRKVVSRFMIPAVAPGLYDSCRLHGPLAMSVQVARLYRCFFLTSTFGASSWWWCVQRCSTTFENTVFDRDRLRWAGAGLRRFTRLKK